jgi:LysM domain
MSYAQKRSALMGAVLALCLIAVSGSRAQVGGSPALNPRHPETYVVQQGDTLWDIASMFLRDPWYWPEIWQINPQVQNPHLIYPGDVLSLAYLDDGTPAIQLTRGPVEGGRVERLSPRVRVQSIEEAIPTIPYETLRAFLSRPAVLDKDDLETLPYIFANPDGLLSSAGRDVYVRGTDADVGATFNLVHAGDPLVDPDDGKLLGYQGLYVGQGRLRRAGDPATLYLTESAREARIGDYLIEEDTVMPANFFPRAPDQAVEGRIISVLDGVSMIGSYQVIVINRGSRDGIEPGHVLSVWQTGETVTDPKRDRRLFAEKVRLPDEIAGTTMVFRTFERMSYALVMDASREMHVLDTVTNPE